MKIRFGEKAFDPEFVGILLRELKPMSDVDFVDLTNYMITTRPANRAPLIADFREARVGLEKKKFNRQVHEAVQHLDRPWQTGLHTFLAKRFPGCKTLNEAIDVRKLQIQVAKANNPSYDPMADPEWQ